MKWKTYRVPTWAAKFFRLKEPTKQAAVVSRRRAHAAAASNTLTYSWNTTEYTPDQIVYQDLRTLRARSRTEYRDNDYARRFINLLADNVAGPSGFDLRAQILNSRNQVDERANADIERNWAKWGMRGNCDVTGCLSWVDMQRLVVKGWGLDGEAVIRKHNSGPFGFQLELIETQRLDERLNEKAPNGNQIKMGIEVNEFGRPMAYWLRGKIQNDALISYSYYHGKDYARIPADQIYHVFAPDLPAQSRGLPRMAVAMLRMNMLGGYEEAAITNARAGASNVMYLTTPDGGDTMPADAEDDLGNKYEDIVPGTVTALPPGYEPVPYDPQYPSGEYGDFVKATLRGVAAGLGVDYSALSGDLEGVNYSSIRAGVLETRETWKALQRFFIDAFVRPVYLDWLHDGLLAQAIVGGNGSPLPMLNRMKYEQVQFAGRRWAWVDPLKDGQAAELMYRLRAKSITEIIMDSGRDPEEVWQQIARENERLDQLGISPEQALEEIVEVVDDE